MDLNIVWYFLIGLLLTGYAVLDGFDFGVGIWHLAVKKDEHRRILLNAIGPVWDGNEVWLVAGGGALFAAFPLAYATVFSGFYLAVIALLFALIFRAVSIEFRGKISAVIFNGQYGLVLFAGQFDMYFFSFAVLNRVMNRLLYYIIYLGRFLDIHAIGRKIRGEPDLGPVEAADITG